VSNQKERRAAQWTARDSDMALMTVEITISDSGQGFALGSQPSMADEMQKALAAHLGVEAPPEGALLTLTLTTDEMRSVVEWLKEHFPSIGFVPVDHEVGVFHQRH
jgi:hypothetical protein